MQRSKAAFTQSDVSRTNKIAYIRVISVYGTAEVNLSTEERLESEEGFGAGKAECDKCCTSVNILYNSPPVHIKLGSMTLYVIHNILRKKNSNRTGGSDTN